MTKEILKVGIVGIELFGLAGASRRKKQIGRTIRNRKIMYTKTLSSDLPSTIDEAVIILLDDLRLLDRTRLGSMTTEELNLVNEVVGLQITLDFRLWSGNTLLLQSCLKALEDSGKKDADPAMAIIHAMWKKLQETHVLRLVK